MFRSTSVLALLAAMSLPAMAADYSEECCTFEDEAPDFRGAYADSPVAIELGGRYWYSMGSQSFSSLNGTVEATDATHSGEVHLRIDDYSTNTFAKANLGYSIVSTGNYSYDVTNPPISFTDSVTGGHVAYAGADFGWNVWGDNSGSGAGFLVGYQYWNDTLTGRNNISNLSSGAVLDYDPVDGEITTQIAGESVANDYSVHALRMGVGGKAKLGDFFDVSAEVAAVPFAKVMGTVGVEDPTFSTAEYTGPAQFPYGGTTGNIASMRSSATEIDGWGYGAQAEAWLGMHPMDNVTFRVGGRASYLQGTVDQTYDRVFITNPGQTVAPGPYDIDPVVTELGVMEVAQPFRMWRYGLLAELTYNF